MKKRVTVMAALLLATGTITGVMNENVQAAVQEVVSNQVVPSEYGGYFYYVNQDGEFVQNTWVWISSDVNGAESLEEGWYYFGSDGKNYCRKGSNFKKKINGNYYVLDENGRLLTGWIDSDGNQVDDGDPFVSGVYYSGDDGALLTEQWLDYYSTVSGGHGSDLESKAAGREYSEYEEMWFYFDENGKKIRGTETKLKEKVIGDNEYGFDENGVMLLWWSPVELDEQIEENRPVMSETSSKFFSGYDGGVLLKDRWVWMYPAANLDSEDYQDGEYSWWRTDEKGKVYRDKILEVNGNTYAFDGIGRMQTGFVLFEGRSHFVAQYDVNSWSSRDFIEGEIYGIDKADLYLFSPDELNDGSMQSGSQIEVELEDGVYTFGFSERTGKAYGNRNRMKKEGDCWYINGLRLEGKEEYGYGVVGVKPEIPAETDPSTVSPEYYQVVDENGRIVEGKGKAVKDREDGYLLILNNKYAGRVWDDGRKVVYKKVDGVEGFYYDDRSRDAEERYELILSKESFDMEHPDMEDLPEEERLNFS